LCVIYFVSAFCSDFRAGGDDIAHPTVGEIQVNRIDTPLQALGGFGYHQGDGRESADTLSRVTNRV
jgi:hypothetical protein